MKSDLCSFNFSDISKNEDDYNKLRVKKNIFTYLSLL